jgi:hypothetical protein
MQTLFCQAIGNQPQRRHRLGLNHYDLRRCRNLRFLRTSATARRNGRRPSLVHQNNRPALIKRSQK